MRISIIIIIFDIVRGEATDREILGNRIFRSARLEQANRWCVILTIAIGSFNILGNVTRMLLYLEVTRALLPIFLPEYPKRRGERTLLTPVIAR